MVKNKPVIIDNIGKTVIYDNKGNIIQTIDKGYLDIGINDTMKDLFVNFVGALVFSFFAYFGLKHNEDNLFINNFVPTKVKENGKICSRSFIKMIFIIDYSKE